MVVVVAMVVLKRTFVFRFGPNLKLKFWPKPKLNKKLKVFLLHTRISCILLVCHMNSMF